MKILVVNLMQIGDLVLTTPIFRAIKTAHPDFFLAAAVNKSFAELLKFNPFLDRLFEFDKASWSNSFKVIRDIRNLNFDLCINLNRSERACLIATASGANLIIGYAKPPFYPFFDCVCPNLKRIVHQVISHFKVLDAAGLHLPLAKSDVFIGDTLLNLSLPDNIVAFNVGASWPSKRWLPVFFANVANHLLARGFYIALLGSNQDLPIVNLVSNFITDMRRVLIFTGNFSLLQLAAFFDYCRLLISNDSGPLHIAAARNLPAISIFGSSPTIGFAPWAPSHSIIKSPAPCHPCYKQECPLQGADNMMCMQKVSPAVVIKYAKELLAKYDKPAKDLPHIQGAYECKIIDLAKEN